MTRLVLISDVRLYAEGLSLMLESGGECSVAAVARDLDDCLMWIHKDGPDAVLVDMKLPDGLGTLRRLALTKPGLPVVALAVPEHERQVRACVDAGASWCVARAAALEDLAAAIDSAVGRKRLSRCGVAAAPPEPAAALQPAAGPSPDDSSWNVLGALVREAPALRMKVEIHPTDLALPLGLVGVFTARAVDKAGKPIQGATFSWASTNDVVARINTRNGIARGVGGGRAQILATENSTGCMAAANVFVVGESPSPSRGPGH